MTHNTFAFLNNLNGRIEAVLQKAIGEWQLVSPEALAFKPGHQQWSAAQCLEHLNIYGRHYLPEIEKAIAIARKKGAQSTPRFVSGWMGAYFIDIMLPKQDGSLKKKMQSPKDAVPSATPDPGATLAEFIDQLETLLKLLEESTFVRLDAVRLPTSLSRLIKLRLGDALGFVVAHLERHTLQIERVLTAQDRKEPVAV